MWMDSAPQHQEVLRCPMNIVRSQEDADAKAESRFGPSPASLGICDIKHIVLLTAECSVATFA